MMDISIKNVSFSYTPDVKALDDVSIKIKAGDFCGIIGPNGSGKTTMLKCISGYHKPQIGDILLSGKNVHSFSTKEIARTMALVQQHFALEYDFTVMEIVLTGRNPHIKRLQSETSNDYDIANEALKRAQVYHLKDRQITTLSGGEWQRMILARALCQQASIMLLDEPVTGLDIKHQVSLMSTAKRLATEEEISVVCVLHDLNLAYNYCNKIALLKSGKLFKFGNSKEVLTTENLEYVYETKINIIENNGETFILPVYNK